MTMNPKQSPFEEQAWLYHGILDAVSDGMILSDLETGLVIEANPAACRMHGRTREGVSGRGGAT